MMIGLLALPGTIFSQGYQQPPKAIMELVDVPPTPALRIGPNGKWALLLQQSSMPSIEELAQPELRLAGLRINPASNGPSRSGGFIGASIIETGTGKTKVVAGLPQNVRMGNLSWSPDGKIAAFSHTTASGIEWGRSVVLLVQIRH